MKIHVNMHLQHPHDVVTVIKFSRLLSQLLAMLLWSQAILYLAAIW